MDSIWLIAFFALGAVMASFLGVVVERLHTGERWISGHSKCNSCAVQLGPASLIPVLSWFASLGRCFACRSRIPFRYPLSEFLLGVVFALGLYVHGVSLELASYLAVVFVLAFIVLYDLRHTIVPWQASSLLVLLSFAHAVLGLGLTGMLGVALMTAGSFALLFLALHVFSGGRAMGLGDAPVVLALSLFAAPYAFAGFLFSFWIGGLFGVAVLGMRPRGSRMGIEVPFVPFLALGFLIAYFIQWNPLALY